MKKKKKAAIKEIQKLHENLKRGLSPEKIRDMETYKVSFNVRDNNSQLLNIASLIEVCVFALDGGGIFLSPGNQNCTKRDSVCRVLEMVLEFLPDRQMYFLDKITEQLTEIKKAKTK